MNPPTVERVDDIDLTILHEPRPHPPAAQVLGAQQRDPEIDGDDVGRLSDGRRPRRPRLQLVLEKDAADLIALLEQNDLEVDAGNR